MDKPKGKPKKLIFLLVLIPLILCCMCCSVIWILSITSPTELKLLNSDSTSWNAENPTETLKFSCNYVTTIFINGKEISTYDEVQDVCNKGYTVQLNDGDNRVEIVAKNYSGSRQQQLDLNIKFDQKAYQDRLAKEEQLKKEQAEKERQEKLSAEEKQKQEQAEKERQDQAASAKAISDWKPKFQQLKKDKVNPAYAKSTEMMNVLSSGTDPYQTRNQAQAYKTWFSKQCGTSFADNTKPVPDKFNEDVKNLDQFYRDFCDYNQYLAQRTIDYLQADSTQKQYEHLDMITYYQQQIADAKFSMEVYIKNIEGKF